MQPFFVLCALRFLVYLKKKGPSPHSGLVVFHKRVDAMPTTFDSDKKLKRNREKQPQLVKNEEMTPYV